MKKRLIWLCFLVLGCTGIPAHSKENDIRLGYVDPFTGGDAHLGLSTRRGLDLAIQQINSAGGVRGSKLRLISLDDQGKLDEASAATLRLITIDQVHVLIGSVFSSKAIAIAPLAQKYHLPMITPSATHPKVTQMGDFIFRSGYADPFQAQVMGRFLIGESKLTRVVLLKDIKSDHSVGLVDGFKATARALGVSILGEESYSGGDSDFRGLLTKVKAMKPDVVYVPGYYGDVGLMLRQARELGLTSTFAGSGAWDSPKLLEIAGAAANGSVFTCQYFSGGASGKGAAFARAFREAYGLEADGHAATGYDAILVLADALRRAGSLRPERIRDALGGTKNVEGVSGLISLDQNRNASKSSILVEVKDQKFEFRGSMSPDFKFNPRREGRKP